MNPILVIAAPRQIAFETQEDLPLGHYRSTHPHPRILGSAPEPEMTQYRGSTPFLHKSWNLDKRLFVPTENTSLTFPIRTLGYEEAGEVIEVGSGVEHIRCGQFVFGTWGHRAFHVAAEADILPRLMPEGVNPLCGIFSHIGAIALNGVHDGRIRIGEEP